MKAILLSIKPKWCALMMNGDKTVEVRTSKTLANAIQKLIDENGYADIYVYCTKDGGYLYPTYDSGGGDPFDILFINGAHLYKKKLKACRLKSEIKFVKGEFPQVVTEMEELSYNDETYLNGKVVARFYCDKVEEIGWYFDKDSCDCIYYTNTLDYDDLLTQSQLDDKKMNKYFENTDEDIVGYAIHISNLEIFDKPKELSEFEIIRKERLKGMYSRGKLTKAPQNFAYIEVEE